MLIILIIKFLIIMQQRILSKKFINYNKERKKIYMNIFEGFNIN